MWQPLAWMKERWDDVWSWLENPAGVFLLYLHFCTEETWQRSGRLKGYFYRHERVPLRTGVVIQFERWGLIWIERLFYTVLRHSSLYNFNISKQSTHHQQVHLTSSTQTGFQELMRAEESHSKQEDGKEAHHVRNSGRWDQWSLLVIKCGT